MQVNTKAIIIAILAALLALTACDPGQPTSQEEEGERRQRSYDTLIERQPGETMEYSPTRETINFWVSTWEQEGKLSFVYLMAGNGQIVGYYVLEGLPVSYCAMLTPNYELIDTPSDGSSARDVLVNAPGIDGAYYSGGQCNQYYGRDATTGAYVEFSIGGSLNYLLFDEPLEADVEPLGFTSVEDVEER